MNKYGYRTLLRHVICGGLLVSASLPLQAAETLLSLYEKALQYDAQYKAAEAMTDAEREEINKSRALFMPRVQFGASVGHGVTDRTTQTNPGSVNTHLNYDIHNYALSLRQPLFNKESIATYRGAEASIQSKEALLLKENATLISRIAGSYFEALYAQEKVEVLRSNIEATTQQRDQAQQRYDHGEGTITEINEAQANLELAQAELITTENSLAAFKQTLGNMTGITVDEIAPLAAEQLPASVPDSDDMEFWLQQALSNNPEITAARLSVEVARQNVEKKRAGHFPTLDLVGVRSYSENDSNNTLGSRFDTTTLALQFNMPLFSGGFTSASVRQAYKQVDAAEEQLNYRTRDIEANTRKYLKSIRSGIQAMSAYRQAVKSSEIALEGTQKGFSAGTRTNIEVLNAQQKLSRSRLELSRVQYVLLNDIINLRQAAGMLNEAQLQALNQYFQTD
ncbi:outer membrane protein, protease secretion system [Methylobacillus rhizosphaerae]|uniref:Outer membrane protein, protease secretion system n=1 Tax=Methylobacillus rhizosphaerae TaxID=551994 RepID=A0A238ZMC3_9PROT|nr:TolC family outer membrane protein [Methylobacillus rhizosphaerae]SNR84517.1 outer membrane protein, protease secretion system [Methylobacillus rhizosphaerae]